MLLVGESLLDLLVDESDEVLVLVVQLLLQDGVVLGSHAVHAVLEKKMKKSDVDISTD